MSHCAKQIRDWVITAIDSVVGLPNPVVGAPRQIASNTDYIYVKPGDETITPQTVDGPTLQQRELSVEVVIIASTYDEVDSYSVLAEEILWSYAAFPAKYMDFNSRSYEEDKTTDRDYVALTLSYTVVYFVAANDVETFI